MPLTSHLFWLGLHGGAFGVVRRRAGVLSPAAARRPHAAERLFPVLSLVTLGVDWKSPRSCELLAGETLLILGKQFSSLGCGLEMP